MPRKFWPTGQWYQNGVCQSGTTGGRGRTELVHELVAAILLLKAKVAQNLVGELSAGLEGGGFGEDEGVVAVEEEALDLMVRAHISACSGNWTSRAIDPFEARQVLCLARRGYSTQRLDLQEACWLAGSLPSLAWSVLGRERRCKRARG